MLTFALLAGCLGGSPEPATKPAEDPTPASPTTTTMPAGDGPVIAVSVPLSGANAALGKAAVEGVRLAVPPGLGVWGIDENAVDPIPVAQGEARVVGVVAHVTEIGAERWAAGWKGLDLPVVIAAPASITGIPRVLAGGDRHLRCASAWAPPSRILLAHDGSMESMAVSNAAEQVLHHASLGVRAIDPRQMATEAGHVRNADARLLMFTGEATTGGNLVRAMRQSDDDTPFLGLGMYDPRFLKAAGSAGEGAIVTSQDRPVVDLDVRDRWREKVGGDPPAVALNAYDAARLLVEAWASAEVPSKAEQRHAIQERLRQVEADGTTGHFSLDDDLVASPAWCTAFQAQGGHLVFHGTARVVDGRVEQVDLAEARETLAEERRIAEEERQAEEQRKAEEAHAAEEARVAEEARAAEEAALAVPPTKAPDAPADQ